MRTNLLLCVLALSAPSCDLLGADDRPSGAGGPLARTWTLQSRELAGRGIELVRTGYVLTLHEDGTITGNAACNTCEGRYERTGVDSLDIRIACTEKACPNDFDEGPVFPHGPSRYEIDRRSLTVIDDGSTFRFEEPVTFE